MGYNGVVSNAAIHPVVVTGTAIERIVAVPAIQRVSSKLAVQDVIPRSSCHGIVRVGADYFPDREERVGADRAAGCRSGSEVYRHRGGLVRIIRGGSRSAAEGNA